MPWHTSAQFYSSANLNTQLRTSRQIRQWYLASAKMPWLNEREVAPIQYQLGYSWNVT